jgi:hypothetical protein
LQISVEEERKTRRREVAEGRRGINPRKLEDGNGRARQSDKAITGIGGRKEAVANRASNPDPRIACSSASRLENMSRAKHGMNFASGFQNSTSQIQQNMDGSGDFDARRRKRLPHMGQRFLPSLVFNYSSKVAIAFDLDRARSDSRCESLLQIPLVIHLIQYDKTNAQTSIDDINHFEKDRKCIDRIPAIIHSPLPCSQCQ